MFNMKRNSAIAVVLGVIGPLMTTMPMHAERTLVVAATPTDTAGAVQHIIDAKSALDIQYSRDGAKITVAVADGTVSVHKEMYLGRSVTTIVSGDDRVGFIMAPGRILIVDQGREIDLAALPTEERAPELERIAGSPTIAKARALLARLSLNVSSVTGNSLLLTKTWLGAISGDTSAAPSYRAAIKASLDQPHATTVRFQKGDSPSYCWNAYSADAIKYANEFIDCKSKCSWYDIVCGWSCDAIYAAEAEGAWGWYIACSGGLAVS